MCHPHLCCEFCLCPLELFKGKLGDLRDNVVDGGLKAGGGLLGDVVGNLGVCGVWVCGGGGDTGRGGGVIVSVCAWKGVEEGSTFASAAYCQNCTKAQACNVSESLAELC